MQFNNRPATTLEGACAALNGGPPVSFLRGYLGATRGWRGRLARNGARFAIFLALASPVNSAPLSCVVLGAEPFACTVRYTTSANPVVYVLEAPLFAGGFES